MEKFYVLEGVDGVGKTTICKRIAELKKWSYASTPPKNFFMKEKQDSKWNILRFMLGMAETTEHIRKKLGKKTVICDRHFPTLIVDGKELGIDLSNFGKNCLKPDKIIHLYTDYETLLERIAARKKMNNSEKRLISDKKYFESMIKSYRKICNAELNNSNLSTDETAEKILKMLGK